MTNRRPSPAYQAACTPDFFLFDADFKLVYRGQFDSSRPGNGIPVTGEDLRAAIDQVLAGKPVPTNQRPPSAATSSGRAATEPGEPGIISERFRRLGRIKAGSASSANCAKMVSPGGLRPTGAGVVSIRQKDL